MPKNTKLIFTVFTIVVVEIALIVFLARAIKDKLNSSFLASEIENQQTFARNLAKHIEDDIAGINDKLSLMTQRTEIASGGATECNRELAESFEILGSKVANLVRVNAKGVIYCAINKDAIGIDVTENEDLKKLFGDPSHPAVVHRITFSPVSNQYVAGLHIPVYDANGKFAGSLGGVIYFSEIEEKFFRGLASGNKNLTLIDDNGDILHTKSSDYIGKNLLSDEILKLIPENMKEEYLRLIKQALLDASEGRSVTLHSKYTSEPERVAVYYPITLTPGRHWLLSISIPVSEITNQLNRNPFVSGLSNYLVLVIGIIAVVLLTQFYLFYFLMGHLKKYHSSKDTGKHRDSVLDSDSDSKTAKK